MAGQLHALQLSGILPGRMTYLSSLKYLLYSAQAQEDSPRSTFKVIVLRYHSDLLMAQ